MTKINNVKLLNNLEIQIVDNQDYLVTGDYQNENNKTDELVTLIYEASDPTIKKVKIGDKNGQDVFIETSGVSYNNKVYQVIHSEDERINTMRMSHLAEKAKGEFEEKLESAITVKDNDIAIVDNLSLVTNVLNKSNKFVEEKIKKIYSSNAEYKKVKDIMNNDKFLHAIQDANKSLQSTIMASKELLPDNFSKLSTITDSDGGLGLVGNFGFNTNIRAFEPDMSPAVPLNAMTTLIASPFPIGKYVNKVPLSGLNRYETQINRVNYGASISNSNSSIQGDADDTALEYSFDTAIVSSQWYQLSYTVNGQIVPANDSMILSHNPDLLNQLYNKGINNALYLRDFYTTLWFQGIDKFGDANFGTKGLFTHPATKVLEYEVEFEANGYTLKSSSIQAILEDIARIILIHPLLHISQQIKFGSIICDQKFVRALQGIYVDKTWLSTSIGGFNKIVGNTIAGSMVDSFMPHLSMDMLIRKDVGGASATPYFGTSTSGKEVKHIFMFQTDPLREYYKSMLPNFENWEEFVSNPLLDPFIDEPMGQTRLAITDYTVGQKSGTSTKIIDIAKKGGYFDILGNRQWIIKLVDKNG